MLRVSGANHLDNLNIRGLALTVSDITTERTLERDVLDVANQERVRLASDIHDGLAQQLVGVKMLIQAVSKRSAEHPERAQEDLREIVNHMGEAVESARSLAHGLSPLHVMRGSLGDALQRLETIAEGVAAVRVAVDRRLTDLALDDNAADHLYRIAREAVQNAIRHGCCASVDVEVRTTDHDLTLSIVDDGQGDPEQSYVPSGLGLRLMDYRARILGGTFVIAGRRPFGTTVQVTVPLRGVLA
jgi:signal transduction histidine kinase